MEENSNYPVSEKIPLLKALSWIALSTLIVSGGSFSLLKGYKYWQEKRKSSPSSYVKSIIQTGPQKEALNTVYLAELLGISVDKPTSIYAFDLNAAKLRLLSSPVIKAAELKVVKPSSIYIDYTVRQPVAWLYDLENIAIDEEGFMFPVTPFFSPKTLPEIYTGPAQMPPLYGMRGSITFDWNVPLQGRYIQLALTILKLLNEPQYRQLLHVKRIDVSKSYAESYGEREVVICLEDEVLLRKEGKELLCIFPCLLRLSTKNYPKELGNFLQLKEQLIEKECQALAIPTIAVDSVRASEKIIDFRLPNLAFIEEK